MIDFKDRLPQQANRKLITPEGGGTPYYATVTFADNPTVSGTPINKTLFLDLQKQIFWGDNCNTVFNVDGSITQTYGTLYRLVTTYPSATQIVQTLTYLPTSTVVATKTTTFNVDGSISEVIA